MRNRSPFSHILPVPDWLFQEDLYVTTAGWERIKPGEHYPHERAAIYAFTWQEGRELPEYCLTLCVEGAGELETRQGRQKITRGDAFLFCPGEWHRHRPLLERGWLNYWINVNGDLVHEWERSGAFRLQGNLPVITDGKLFKAQFERILESVDAAPTGNSQELCWQALGLFAHFVSGRSVEVPRTGSSATNDVERALNFILNHTHNSINVAEVVAHVGCSRRTLETSFKKSTGRTVLEEIQHCRVDRARMLLAETRMPIKQIVRRAGYQSHERMRLAFKQILGITPGDVRRGRAPAEM